MYKHVFSLLFAMCLLAGACPAMAAAWEPDFSLEGASFLLICLDNGETVYERNSDEVRSPASMTKMMTALLAMEHGVNMDDTVTVPESLSKELKLIEQENGMSINMKVGEVFTVRDLLYLTLLPSCNDAASLLAYHISGDLDTFIEEMNQRAAQLGCTHTNFNCAHGLFEEFGDGNWSTAQDMALIAQEFMKWPELMEIVETTEYWLPLSATRTTPSTRSDQPAVIPDGMYRLMYSTNPLQKKDNLLYRSYDHGIKTGYTTWALKCFATSFQMDDAQYLLVEMGVPNETDKDGNQLVFRQATQLGDWLESQFTYSDLSLTMPKYSVPVQNSLDGNSVPLVTSGSAMVLVNQGDSITWNADLPEALQAPVTAGDVVGTATVYRNGQAMGTVELLAAETLDYSLRAHFGQGICRMLENSAS